ncbi:hypothetical protein BHE74_00022454 [Ensete ventricosum]|nr:hypothetical protein GW17_00026044 [Ensete ventricosum]RWW69907.1 hypothetical protein BHE74_00022454 [Ensete ventricosum]
MYPSASCPVRGLSATEQYRRNRPKRREKNLVPLCAALLRFPLAHGRRIAHAIRRPRAISLPTGDSLSPRKETTRFAISICTAQYGQYIIPPSRLPVRRPLATGRYRQNRLSTIDFGRQRSIKGEIDRRRSIEGEKGKKQKRKRRNKERRGRKKTTSFPGAVLARTSSPPAGRSRAVLAHRRFFSRSRRQNFSRRGEKD